MLDHRADPNVSGPRETPLQLAWRRFRSPSFRHDPPGDNDEYRDEKYDRLLQHMQKVMNLLLDFGAEASWVEPNEVTIDRRTIEAWCAMSKEELDARWEEEDHPYCEADWYTYEFPLYRTTERRSCLSCCEDRGEEVTPRVLDLHNESMDQDELPDYESPDQE